MTTKFKIDKNMPIPIVSKYPFLDMAIGDSFFLPRKKNGGRITFQGYAIRRKRNGLSGKIITRTCVECGVKGTRVWIVADDKEGAV